MARQTLNQFLLYRWRYVFAYIVFAAALGTLLVVAGFYLPGGLSQTEVNSALISEGLNPTALFSLQPQELIYLPYHLLQAASISVFGFTTFGIKFPSILLGFIAALALLYLLNIWYKRGVAIVTATIAVTTAQFLLAAQAGTAGVTYIALTALVLVAASMLARRSAYANIIVLVGFILAAVSLYMPLNIYVLIALALTAIVHPHARHVLLRQASKPIIAAGFVLFALLISPLVIGILNQPGILSALAGIPNDLGAFSANTAELFRQYGQVYAPSVGLVIIPVYGLGILALIALGFYRMISTKYTTKSYIMSFWLLLLIPMVILNPQFINITFVPVLLLIALGIDYLTSSWYRLFPRNPYARVFGLIPLAVLVGGLVISNIDRYSYGFRYDSNVHSYYTFDLTTLSKELRTYQENDKVTLIVETKNKKMYEAYAQHQSYVSKLMVTTTVPTNPSIEPGRSLIAERAIRNNGLVPSKILVSGTTKESDRFYLYKSNES